MVGGGSWSERVRYFDISECLPAFCGEKNDSQMQDGTTGGVRGFDQDFHAYITKRVKPFCQLFK